MANKYLDYDGMLYFWQKLKTLFAGKVDSETGKGLSSNDFTTAEKSKLAGIDDNANATTVDSALSDSSENPLQNKAIYAALSGKVGSDSPAFTGTPTAPTASAGTNTTQIATTAFVKVAVDAASVGSTAFQGTVSAEADISGLGDYHRGWYWVVSTAGSYVGETCEPGDFIFCVSDHSGSYSASDFSVVQANLDIAAITNGEIDTIVAT